MPELSREKMYRCSSHEMEREVKSSSDPTKTYNVTVDSCTCPGFKYNGDCKHHKHFLETECLWDELVDEGSVGKSKYDEPICPKCGMDAEAYQVDA